MYARLLLGGGGTNGNSRYDNELSSGGESGFFKRAPPKSTLMDYMTSLKLSHETKASNNDENEKLRDRSETKRRTEEPFHSTNKNNQDAPAIYPNSNASDQTVFQQTGIYESLDSEDDPSQSGYRERRNPLPPRFVSPALFSVRLVKRGVEMFLRRGVLILHQNTDLSICQHQMSAFCRKFEIHRNIGIIVKEIAPWFSRLWNIGSDEFIVTLRSCSSSLPLRVSFD